MRKLGTFAALIAAALAGAGAAKVVTGPAPLATSDAVRAALQQARGDMQQSPTQAQLQQVQQALMKKRPELFTRHQGKPWPWWVGAGKTRTTYAARVARRQA